MQGFDDLHLMVSPRTAEELQEFKTFVFSHFDVLDLDKDGFLSKEEIETAMTNRNRTLLEEEALAFLLKRLRQISLTHNEAVERPDSISRDDVESFFAQLESK